MQTYLHGRDLIGDLDFSKEEVETVLDVAFDLKRKRALNEPHAYLRDKVLAMLFFFSSTRTRGSFEAGMAQLGGHGAFIESNTTQISHGDTPKEIGEIFGRYFDGIAIRHCDWRVGNGYLNAVAQGVARAGAQHAVRHLPPVPVPGRPDDHHREEGPRPAPQEDGRLVGLRRVVPEADVGAAIADPADAALRHGCRPGASARVPADARDHGAGRRSRRASSSTSFEIVGRTAWTPRSRMRTSSTPSRGGRCCTTADKAEGKNHPGVLQALDHRRAQDGPGASPTPSTCTRCPPTATSKSPTPSSTARNSVVYDEAENRLHAQKAVMALTM